MRLQRPSQQTPRRFREELLRRSKRVSLGANAESARCSRACIKCGQRVAAFCALVLKRNLVLCSLLIKNVADALGH